MIDVDKRDAKEQFRERTRRRMQAEIDPDNYEYIPEIKPVDYYDNDIPQRVGIYVRVSTDDVRQTTSFELQKKYYEDFVIKHPNWTLVKIYADEGISGTSLNKRDAFNAMVADAKAGKMDMIVTKSVSRFARNVVDFIGIVRNLAEKCPPVGVFFESEAIFSLNEDSQLALSFQATMAEEESHTRSRSMETSLRMRLDNGIPLTPKLIGYTHDADGNLVPNPDEAPTVKLAFFMYLYGYSTQQIADAFTALGRKTYLGNVKWNSSSIVQILRNERHCGEVLTRKTYTPNFRTHKARKNKGQRPQSRYINHHTPIVSRDDFIAVQRMLNNAKYGNKSILPELKVVDNGLLKGFVTINPRWAGFKERDYIQAAFSAYNSEEELMEPDEYSVEVEAGDFDLRGFEIARSELFDLKEQPWINFSGKRIRLSSNVVRKFGERNCVELLINPIKRKFAIRATETQNRNGVIISKKEMGIWVPREIAITAFGDTLFSLFDWNFDYRYRTLGRLYETEGEMVYIFDTYESEVFVNSFVVPNAETDFDEQLVSKPCNRRIRAIPEWWTTSFGKQFYIYEQTLVALENQNKEDWKLRLEGRLYETGAKLNVTDFEIIRDYIKQELNGITLLEENDE
ncbi:MAG: recombinase family protein [Clostridia bacterium]|nr:recombinase family protein [Clostridia bacterium]